MARLIPDGTKQSDGGGWLRWWTSIAMRSDLRPQFSQREYRGWDSSGGEGAGVIF